MKKIALVFLSALAAVGFYVGLTRKPFPSGETVSPTSEVLGVPDQNKGIDIDFGSKIFKAYFIKVANAADITLLANFEKGETARTIFEKGVCQALVSGGFYTPEGSPTGLFISEGRQIKKYVRSSFANAIYSINDFETPRITQEPPWDHLRVGLQAGPFLIENLSAQRLSLRADEEARRMVVGVTGENETVFMVFYKPNSVFAGPTLASLPHVLTAFQEESGIILADAMNLDGGTATAFYTSEVQLPEASPVGSFFCIH